MTDSHHWLKVVVLFLSNFSRFSIFSRDVRIGSCLVAGYCWARATPSATNCTSSCGVNVGHWSFGGDGGGDGDAGNGGVEGPDGGLKGGPPLLALCGFLQPGGVAWLGGMAGIAGGRILLLVGEIGSLMGFRSGGQVGSGTFGVVGALVLGGWTGLRQS